MNNELYEKKFLKLNVDDKSYIFIKPDSAEYRGKVGVIIQDTSGNCFLVIHVRETMEEYLSNEQIEQVYKFLDEKTPLENQTKASSLLSRLYDNALSRIVSLENQLAEAKAILSSAKEQLVSQSQHLAVQNGKLSVFENMMQLFKGDRHGDRNACCNGDNPLWQIDNFLRQAEQTPDRNDTRDLSAFNSDFPIKSYAGLDTLGKGLHGDTYNQKAEGVRPPKDQSYTDLQDQLQKDREEYNSKSNIGLGGLNDQ